MLIALSSVDRIKGTVIGSARARRVMCMRRAVLDNNSPVPLFCDDIGFGIIHQCSHSGYLWGPVDQPLGATACGSHRIVPPRAAAIRSRWTASDVARSLIC